jgi:hypothetical protein
METYKAVWVGGELPLWEKASLLSFVRHGQKIELFTYGDVTIPEGVTPRDANEIIPKDQVFVNVKDGAGSYSGFADRFRYQMLYKEGGCYVDTDIIMLKVAYLPEFAFAQEDDTYINNALLKIPAGHKILQDMYETCVNMNTNFSWGDTGPKLLTKKLTEYALSDKKLPREFAYAIGPGNARSFIIQGQDIDTKLENSCFVHWWHEVFRRSNIDVNRMPPEGSWLHKKFTEILEF